MGQVKGKKEEGAKSIEERGKRCRSYIVRIGGQDRVGIDRAESGGREFRAVKKGGGRE